MKDICDSLMKLPRLSFAIRVALLYGFIGGLWILLSDRAIDVFIRDQQSLGIIQTYKGWFFVIVTAGILFLLLKEEIHAQEVAENKFKDIFENAVDGFFQSSQDGKFLTVNPAMAKIFGYESPGEMIAQIGNIGIQLHISLENRQRFIDLLTERGAVEKFEAQNFRKDGSIIWTSTNARIVRDEAGHLLYFEGFVQDISERKWAETNLRLAEARYRVLVEQLPAAVYTEEHNKENFHSYISPQIEKILGYTIDELHKNPELWREAIHPDDREAVLSEDEHTAQTLEPYQVEYRAITKDGRIIWLRDQAVVICDENGVPMYWQGILMDISEQRRVEETIRQGEERFSKVFQASSMAICITSLDDDKFIDANQAYWRLSGLTRKQVNNHPAPELNFLDGGFERKTLSQQLRQKKSIRGLEATFKTISGEMKDVLVFYELMQLGDQDCVLAMFHDITEQKRARADLSRREAILNAIAFAADQFLKSPVWTNNINQILEKLGRAADASRVYIFKRHFTQAHVVSQLFEWSAPDVEPQINNPRLQKFDFVANGLGRWLEYFQRGEPFQGIVGRLPAGEREEFIREDILSLICVPIMTENNWWGFIGLDDCKTERNWSESEIDALRTASNILSAAIQKEKVGQSVQKQLEELMMLHAVALANSSAPNLDDLLSRITEIIDDTLHPDNCGILLLSDNKQVLIPHPSYRGYTLYDIRVPLSVDRGVTGKAVSTRKAMRLADVSAVPEYVQITQGICSELCAPIISGGEVVGVINLESKQKDAFTETDERLLNTIAGGIGTAIEKLKLFEAERRRTRDAENLREATISLTKSLDLTTLLQSTLDLLPTFAGFDSALVVLENNGQLEVVAGHGLSDEVIHKFISFDALSNLVNAEQEPVIIEDAQIEPRLKNVPGMEAIRGWLSVPLVVNNKIIGFLALGSYHPGVYSHQQATLVQTFANQVAIAIQNASSFEAEQKQRLREASMLDLMRVAASSLDLEETLERILGHLLGLIPASAGTIQLLNSDRLRVSATIGFDLQTIRPGNVLLLDDFPLNNEIATQKHAVRIADARGDERFRWLPGTENVRSFLGVPIIFKGNAIGIATLDSEQVNHFTEQDEELAFAIANNAANAIGNARIFESEQRRRQEAENLRLAAAAVTSSLESEEVLQTILVALRQVVPYDSASMLLQEGDMVRITAAQGLPNLEEALNQSFPADNKLLQAVLEKGTPVILYDAQVDPRFERWAAADKVRGWMGVPLITRGQIIGYITLDSYKVGTFDENSAALAQTFAHQASAAIHSSRLYEANRRRLDDLEVARRVSFSVRAARGPDEMLPILMREIVRIMDTDAASIWLHNASTNKLDQKISSGWHQQVDIKSMEPEDSIVGYVYKTGEVHVIEDIQTDIYTHPSVRDKFGQGWCGVAVPIRTTTQTIGVMVVTLPPPRKVEPDRVQILTTIAEIAGSAIHRVQLYEQSEEQVRRLTALRDVDTAIASSFDLRVTLNILLDHVITLLDVDAADILSYNSDLRTLTHIASLGFSQTGSPQIFVVVGNRLLNDTFLERKDIYIEDVNLDPAFHRKELVAAEKFVSYYATLLISKGQVKGILEVYRRHSLLPEEDWLDFFHTMAGQAAIAIDNSQLFDNLQRSNQELSLAYDTTLEGWGKALELRDKETQGHTLRVTEQTLRLARRLGMPEADLIHVRRGVLLHDIGKMAVPDNILKKNGPLTEEEWAEMRQHPQHAYDLLYPIAYLRPILDIPYCHHERWDGKGYPRGLKGEEIPLSARIFTVVDVWDALLYDRPYREAWPREQIIEYLKNEAGNRFDPAVVDEFLKMILEEEY